MKSTSRPSENDIQGDLSVRQEDIIFITEDGAANMTKWTGTPEEPAVL